MKKWADYAEKIKAERDETIRFTREETLRSIAEGKADVKSYEEVFKKNMKTKPIPTTARNRLETLKKRAEILKKVEGNWHGKRILIRN